MEYTAVFSPHFKEARIFGHADRGERFVVRVYVSEWMKESEWQHRGCDTPAAMYLPSNNTGT